LKRESSHYAVFIWCIIGSIVHIHDDDLQNALNV
ncbi:hypothetical protein ACLKA6_010234, partial [Drosophila palustris]